MKRIFELAIQALTDPDAVLVLGDAVQESGWFDPRVIRAMHPAGRTLGRSHQTRKRFAALANKPSADFARAVAAVAIFGGWSKRRWPLVDRCQTNYLVWSDMTITIGGVPLRDVTDIRYSRDRDLDALAENGFGVRRVSP